MALHLYSFDHITGEECSAVVARYLARVIGHLPRGQELLKSFSLLALTLSHDATLRVQVFERVK